MALDRTTKGVLLGFASFAVFSFSDGGSFRADLFAAGLHHDNVSLFLEGTGWLPESLNRHSRNYGEMMTPGRSFPKCRHRCLNGLEISFVTFVSFWSAKQSLELSR
jgi:hypothetical protein